MAYGEDNCGQTIASEHADWNAYLQDHNPHGLFVPSVLVGPDRIVDYQEDLAASGEESAHVGRVLVLAEDKES